MYLTAEMLREKGASCVQVVAFEKEWPDGNEVSATTIERAVELGLDIVWFAEQFLPAWRTQRETLNDTFWAQVRTLENAYRALRETRNDTYRAQVRTLEDTFWAQAQTVEDTYWDKVRTLEDTYRAQMRTLEDTFWAQRRTVEDTYRAQRKTVIISLVEE